MKQLLFITPLALVACTQTAVICNDELFFDGKIGGPVNECEREPATLWGPPTMERDNDKRTSRPTSQGSTESAVESDDVGSPAEDVEDTEQAVDEKSEESSTNDGAEVEPDQPEEKEPEPVEQTEEEHVSDGNTGLSQAEIERKEANQARVAAHEERKAELAERKAANAAAREDRRAQAMMDGGKD